MFLSACGMNWGQWSSLDCCWGYLKCSYIGVFEPDSLFFFCWSCTVENAALEGGAKVAGYMPLLYLPNPGLFKRLVQTPV